MKLLKKMYLCTLACLFLSNCGEEVRFKKIPDAPIPPTVNPTPPPIQAQKVEEDFIQSDTEGSADILFVVDNSGSMFNEQEKVGEKINSMISKIQKIEEIAYHLLVWLEKLMMLVKLSNGMQH